MTTTEQATSAKAKDARAENAAYKAKITEAAKPVLAQAELQQFDPEMLVRRGSYYVLVTPELAAQFLDRNQGNRKYKRRAITAYARDMMAGDWDPDASDIKFAKDGTLIDGQNRCMASVESGASFGTLIRTGLNKDARFHMDTGVKRTGGDTFLMRGIADPNNVSAAINMRERYEVTVQQYNGQQTMNPRRVPMTHSELSEYLDSHPSIMAMSNLGAAMQAVGPGVPRSVYIAALSMFAESSEKMAREFAEAFIDGKSSGTGDPILALMRYLARAKSPAELKTKSRNKNQQHLAAFVLAWNAWVSSEKMESLRVRDSDLFQQPV